MKLLHIKYMKEGGRKPELLQFSQNKNNADR
jgi:hypothetical protein